MQNLHSPLHIILMRHRIIFSSQSLKIDLPLFVGRGRWFGSTCGTTTHHQAALFVYNGGPHLLIHESIQDAVEAFIVMQALSPCAVEACKEDLNKYI